MTGYRSPPLGRIATLLLVTTLVAGVSEALSIGKAAERDDFNVNLIKRQRTSSSSEGPRPQSTTRRNQNASSGAPEPSRTSSSSRPSTTPRPTSSGPSLKRKEVDVMHHFHYTLIVHLLKRLRL
ncbi:hypothetical protein FA15DRAFT_672520 [Coprinopsis marcescibilis]|uniref:Uncharacterized protein n=1 Tax=Coprinopsis marcescibilis TaxID=230819 RepID=A0A5C3KMS7_COPMA|nr:hypothetical protein FA15DRAFT_672520 [Coprinopsis marcescibilis]